ncbi:XTP/dITP diphosphatase [Paenibacillus psychroresistens]|uniref:dITP/XTP pyrophosphatase n=1 Tax=Paenibacillus psychroresistens TaxID=1778678 RepID=A0A6B8RQ11_9BACL|nr:XTP/dITP diphosphatase [Paenibacillus psychroresistens]QGQ97894.1 XTP/dITP diphosphatase [Paenibacillus psychroresistens]
MPNLNVIVIATRNAGKVREFAALFAGKQLVIRSLLDYAEIPSVEEDGLTFGANALKKAKALALELGVPVLADDSGLCVDALNGAPGVWSARFAGEHATDADNNAKLLLALQNDEQSASEKLSADSSPLLLSKAQYVCALAMYNPLTDEVIQVEQTCEGFIIQETRGSRGFGYDPLFYLPEFGLTMAELPHDQKNQISHRAKALQLLLQRMDGLELK